MPNGFIFSFIAAVIFYSLTATQSFAADQTRGLSRTPQSAAQPISASDPVIKGRFRALIIGNNDYRDHEKVWAPLRTAVAGADALAKMLKDQYAFGDVRVLKNAKYREIVKAMSELVDSTQEKDNILIYYAGHGYQNEKTGEAYWIPVDAEGWDDSLFVSNGRIKEKLAALSGSAGHVMLVSDSCFSGTLIRGGSRGVAKTERTRQYFQKIATRKSVQILAAGGVEYVDDDYRNSGQSPFTYFLLQELEHNSEQYLSATELSTEIEVKVANNVQQTPQKGVLHGAGDEGGEFVFVKTVLARAEPPPPPIEPPVSKKSIVAPEAETVVTPVPAAPPAAPAAQRETYIPLVTM